MGTRNKAFVSAEKGFGRGQCDVGLGLKMQQVGESCPSKTFVPMPHHQLSSSSCCGDAFDGGASGGGPIVCNTSNQVPCTGDIYDVVGAASASSSSAAAVVLKSLQHHHQYNADPSFPHNSSGEIAAMPVNGRFPFTAAQWHELERQTMIYKYMMASLPVPPELLIPLTRNSSNVIKGSLELGISSNSSDPEPWRCRRTDGKKWRCSRDVAPDQKYCERHSHKSRPRSRKPVELPNNDHKSHTHTLNIASDSSKQQPHQNPHNFVNHNDTNLFTVSFDQPRCLEWYLKGENATVPFTSNLNSEWLQFGENMSENHQNMQTEQFNPSLASLGGAAHSQETRSFIDAWSTAEREVGEVDGLGTKNSLSSNQKLLPLSSLTLSMSGGNENNIQEDEESSKMGEFGIMGLSTENVRCFRPQWMGSPPGGPLAEALCLGIASSQSTSTSSCSKST